MNKYILLLLISSFSALKAMENAGCDISGLDKKEVLRALFRNAEPQGLGFVQYNSADTISDEEAEKLLKKGYIDYLKGRVMKIDLSKSVVDTYLYNRDNGNNAAENVIEKLKVNLKK
jgi:hypothetical protein